MQPAPAPTPVDYTRYEKVRVVMARGLDSFVGDHKHRKGFPREFAAGRSYVGLSAGDQRCEADPSTDYQRFVFARDAGGASTGEYKILEIPDRGPDKKKLTGLLPDASVSELRRLLAEGFRVRDLFHEDGLHIILERQAEARVSPVETSER